MLGNDVWIGENVSIMCGVRIGNGAVIGACSFVNKDIPPYAIAAGIPCKVIKYRFPQNIINKLEQTKWWDLEPKELYAWYDTLVKLVKADS